MTFVLETFMSDRTAISLRETGTVCKAVDDNIGTVCLNSAVHVKTATSNNIATLCLLLTKVGIVTIIAAKECSTICLMFNSTMSSRLRDFLCLPWWIQQWKFVLASLANRQEQIKMEFGIPNIMPDKLT